MEQLLPEFRCSRGGTSIFRRAWTLKPRALVFSLRDSICQASLSLFRESRTCHPIRHHRSLLPITQWQELGGILGLFRTSVDQSSLVVQWLKAFLLQWLGLLPWHRFSPRRGSFACCRYGQKNPNLLGMGDPTSCRVCSWELLSENAIARVICKSAHYPHMSFAI